MNGFENNDLTQPLIEEPVEESTQLQADAAGATIENTDAHQDNQADGGETPEAFAEDPASKKSRKGLFLIIAAAAAVLTAVIFLCINLFASPFQKIIDGAKKTEEAVYSSELCEKAAKFLENGRMALNIDLSENPELSKAITGQETGLNINAEASMYINKTGYAASANIKMGVLSVFDLLLVLDRNHIAASSNTLFSKNNYGIDLTNLSENFKNSIFDPDSGSSYAIDGRVFDSLSGMLSAPAFSFRLDSEDQRALNDLEEEFLNIIEKHAVISENTEKISIAGEDIKADVVSAKAEAETFKTILSETIDYIENEESLKALYEKVMDCYNSSHYYDIPNPDSWDSALKKARDDIETMETDFSIELRGYLKNSYLLRCEIIYETGSDKVSCDFTIGPDPQAPEEISFSAYLNGENLLFAGYSVDENSEDAFSSHFAVSLPSTENDNGSFSSSFGSMLPLKIGFDLNRKNGDFSVMARGESYDTVLNGNLFKDDDHIVISLDSFVNDGETTNLRGISLTFDFDAQMPEINDYKDILKMSEDEFEELISLFDSFGSNFNPAGILQ